MLGDPVDVFFLPDNDSRLRPTQQLIAAEEHDVEPAAILSRASFVLNAIFREIDQRAAADVVDYG